MTFKPHKRIHILWVIPPLVLGIAVMMFMVRGKQPPQRSESGEPTRAVRVITVPRVDLVPTASGYGSVQPARVWTAVAQVSGRIIEQHPRLRNGEIIEKGEVLFHIDPVDYRLALAQTRAELAELDVQEKNSQALVAIEKRNLILAGNELQRIQKLVSNNTASQSDADSSERSLLNTRTALQNLNNSLALIPTRRQVLETKVAQAGRDLDNTTVKAPFNLRVAKLSIEADQYVSKGQSLFEGDGVDRIEVVGQFAISALRNLFIGRPDQVRTLESLNRDLSEITGFKPVIKMDMGNHTAEWDAEFIRFSDNVDAETRTMGIVVAVDKPLSKMKPGQRPPLSKGMFVQVLLSGHTQPQRVVVPRTAVRGGKIYLLDKDSRLRIQDASVLFNQGDLSVLDTGELAGRQIVVSDVVPAVEGMLLQPQVDSDLENRLIKTAGDGS
jgi:RND family efflux transporter MFP subunit